MALFRPEALSAQQTKWLGNIILIRPLSFTFLTVLAVCLASLLVFFLGWASYTKRITVSGQLVPNTGLVKVYVPQSGIVLHKFVSEGQMVKQGELLYVLTNERHSSTQGETQITISRQVEARQQSLQDELTKTRTLQHDEHHILLKKTASLQVELTKLDHQIDSQQHRTTLAQESVLRYQTLLEQDYISQEQLQQKQADLLDQRNRLHGLERDRLSLRRNLDAQQSDLSSLSLRQQNQIAQIERAIVSMAQELTESEAKRRLVVTAPEAGTATAITAEIGQAVDTSKPLVSIVPTHAVLQANLYAPSKAIGFIKAGDMVLLRYQAYPYQKFGHAKGTVASVSKTALPLNALGNFSPTDLTNQNEALYRIKVNLQQQTIKLYGKIQPLQAGMLLDADVLQETRQLYEWILEPLYSLRGAF